MKKSSAFGRNIRAGAVGAVLLASAVAPSAVAGVDHDAPVGVAALPIPFVHAGLPRLSALDLALGRPASPLLGPRAAAGCALGTAPWGGCEAWSARRDGAGGTDLAVAIASSPNGSRVFAAGTEWHGARSFDLAVVAYDASSGQELWSSSYNGPGNTWDAAFAVAVSPDGSRVVATGYSIGSGTLADWATVAYDAVTGSALWTARHDGPGHAEDAAFALAFSPSGSAVFVAGFEHNSSALQEDAVVAAYDSQTGRELWVARYGGPAARDDRFVAVSALGNRVFVTGFSQAASGLPDYVTAAYGAAEGQQLWTAHYDGPGLDWDAPFGIGADPEGERVYVTGVSRDANPPPVGPAPRRGYDYATIAYAAEDGSQVWIQRYNALGPAANGLDLAWALAVSPDGSRVYVTGDSDGVLGPEIATIAYDAGTGVPSWTARHGSAGIRAESAYSVAASPSGDRIYIVGTSQVRFNGPCVMIWDDVACAWVSDVDGVLLSYDAATGLERWEAERGAEQPQGLSVLAAVGVPSDGGRVYATGVEWAGSSGFDMLTVAYEANGRLS